MASVIQSAGAFDASGTATSEVATFGAGTGASRTLIAFVNVYNGTSVSSVTDNQSNTWVFVEARRSSTDTNLQLEAWKCESATASVTTVTANLSGGSYVGLAILEVDGGAVSASTDAQTTPTAGVNISAAPITAAVDGLHLAAMGYEGSAFTFVASGGWTETIEVDESNTAGAVIVEQRTAANTVAQTPTWTTSGSFQVLIVHLVIADAGGGGAPANDARIVIQGVN
jgi:hypothetical protein